MRVSQVLSALAAVVSVCVLLARKEKRNAGLVLCGVSLLLVLAAVALQCEGLVFAACVLATALFIIGYFKNNTNRKEGKQCAT
jgi:hypothetical protein